MSHPKDNEIYPVGTTVKVLRGYNKGKVAVIKEQDFQFYGKGFLNYRATIEGREGLYALYHGDLEVIEFPEPPKENDILINGKQYDLWREGKYIGIATYTEDDPALGDVFLRPVERDGKVIHQVFMADSWRLISGT
jgi:hypothetical protein